MLFDRKDSGERSRKYKTFAFFFLLINIGGCSSLTHLPVMGTVSDGVYTQPQGNFSCPLLAAPIGLTGAPKITDAYRVTRTEHIPLSERESGDWRNNRIVSDETHASRIVKFEDATGAVIEIASGRRSHPVEMTLADGMGRSSSWLFDKREMTRPSGRMMSALMLVPWHEEGMMYMGENIAEAYRQGRFGKKDAYLWIRNNLVLGNAVHTINVQIPAVRFLSSEVHPRDLLAIRDYINAHSELQEELFTQSSAWLESCTFSGEPQ